MPFWRGPCFLSQDVPRNVWHLQKCLGMLNLEISGGFLLFFPKELLWNCCGTCWNKRWRSRWWGDFQQGHLATNLGRALQGVVLVVQGTSWGPWHPKRTKEWADHRRYLYVFITRVFYFFKTFLDIFRRYSSCPQYPCYTVLDTCRSDFTCECPHTSCANSSTDLPKMRNTEQRSATITMWFCFSVQMRVVCSADCLRIVLAVCSAVQVVDASDVLVFVLDARDPMGTRCLQLERGSSGIASSLEKWNDMMAK